MYSATNPVDLLASVKGLLHVVQDMVVDGEWGSLPLNHKTLDHRTIDSGLREADHILRSVWSTLEIVRQGEYYREDAS
jgi:hypothetical protein